MKIYNTMTRNKETFVPIEEGKVKMYVCGPTVYNYMHIGNARPFVIFDVVRRYFEYKGLEVNYVQNYTDIDDKIIKKAIEEGVSSDAVANKYIKEIEVDAKSLGVKKATHNPKVTEEVEGIVDMIKDLINKNHAYVVEGTVYFESNTFDGYGKLSGKNIDDLEAGKRVAVEIEKRNPSDFVLWKPRKEGEPAWPSPWSDGRPGWHIECSVMAKRYLGNSIDIHAGGTDLIFPHHENEIAQSECSNGVEFAKYWMHNGFINVENKKMSKSLNNFFTVREISEEIPYEVIRFFLLNAHYRSPINFSKVLMESATKSLDRIKTGYDKSSKYLVKARDEKTPHNSMAEMSSEEEKVLISFRDDFEKGMDDDFNTAAAIATIFDMVKYINLNFDNKTNVEYVKNFNELFTELCDILGIAYLREEVLLDSDIEELITKRQQARKDKDFTMADKIRDDLVARGIVLEDTREGVRYKRV